MEKFRTEPQISKNQYVIAFFAFLNEFSNTMIFNEKTIAFTGYSVVFNFLVFERKVCGSAGYRRHV